MRHVIESLKASRIREVANAGLGRDDVLPFWFGESDAVTADFIREAAIESIQRGETFYSHNFGLPALREAIADYMARWHPSQAARAWIDRVIVTSGGVNALMLVCQALVDADDEVVVVTPVWPNLVAQPTILGAHVRTVSLAPDATGAWRLDVEALLQGITASTRLLIVNSPNNPTGWTLTADEQRRILAHCRHTGTWILSDEVYERLYFAGGEGDLAPSFLDVAKPDDRLVVVHSFSKSFLMTGWRLGWLVLPSALTEAVGKLVEFNTSCAPVFAQRAGIEALRREAEVAPALIRHLRACHETLVPALRSLPGVTVAPAAGGMYAFFRLAGHDDCLMTAKRLVREAGVGLAPGSAFGAEAAGWLRWCVASQRTDRLLQGVDRLGAWLRL